MSNLAIEKFVKASITINKVKDRVHMYNIMVSKAGFGYTLGDELTKLLNKCPWRETEGIIELISQIENESGVAFPWGDLE